MPSCFDKHSLAASLDLDRLSVNPPFALLYQEARDRFLDRARKADAKITSYVLEKCTGPNGEQLSIDTAYVGYENATNVMICFCGTHGVENSHGSAIEQSFLSVNPQLPKGCGILFVHAFTADGVAFNSRTNFLNIDINRNCINGVHPTGVPEEFNQFSELLHPKSEPALDASLGQLAHIFSDQELRGNFLNGVTTGQYGIPDGLFYGGTEPSENFAFLQEFLPRALPAVSRLVIVDYHSGLGGYAEETILLRAWGSEERTASLMSYAVQKFPGAKDLGAVPYFLKVKGSVGEGVAELFPGREVLLVAAEYGTRSLTDVYGALIRENFERFRNRRSDKVSIDSPAKLQLLDAFAPSESSWRDPVFRKSLETFFHAADIAFMMVS